MTSKFIFVDSSFFKAVIDENDDFHTKSLKHLGKMKDHSIEMVTSNFILDESYTLIRVKNSLEKAIAFRSFLAEGVDHLRVERVRLNDEVAAWEWFQNDWGKKLSFTDCTSFVVMKRLGLGYAATFDEHFKKAGFKIFN